jgi:MYXO-CTERM domain-containing protein
MTRLRLLLLVVVLVLCAAAPAAAWPPDPSVTDLSAPATWPNDPGYNGQWWLWSFVPADLQQKLRDAGRDEEITLGAGMHVDRAWQITPGDRRVVVATLDSGFYWSETDLVNQWYLNRGELPPPEEGCRTAAFDAADPWDANGDGIFNVQDYSQQSAHETPTTPCDSRVSDANGNGILDPEDLILLFSDGTDADGNGYVDDICGWDFFEDDNNAFDQTHYGHGTAQARHATAEADNGRDRAGVCPGCMALPLRVGDSFFTDSTHFAEAVIYAVDNGVSAIAEALGTPNNSVYSHAAIDYAYSQGVAISASAADENSYHHNMPATSNHMIYVHPVRYNASDMSQATTFLAFDSCSNYGAQLQISVPSPGCSSGSTAQLGGVIGLLQSAALKVDLPAPRDFASDTKKVRRLSAEEVRQLIIGTTDDINIPQSQGPNADPALYESLPGWDQRFAYGRANVRRAVDAIVAGRIPPEVYVDEPLWFQVVYPERTPRIDLKGQIAWRADRYESADVVIEWAPGVEPADSEFTTLDQRTLTAPVTGTLYTWDVSQVVVDNPPMPKPDTMVNRHLVTVRVRTVLHSATPALDGVKGEMRKAFHLHRDPDLLPGYPVFLGGSNEGSPKMADLDGDGKRELIVANSDGMVHALRADGTELPGFPVMVGPFPSLDAANPKNHRAGRAYAAGDVSPEVPQPNFAAPAIGDLDGDGKPEIVVSTGSGAQVFVFGSDGAPKAGWPQGIDPADVTDTGPERMLERAFIGAPVLADLDGDGQLEVIIAGGDAKVHVWRHDGTLQPGFPVLLQEVKDLPPEPKLARSVSTPAVGDIDGDGKLEIVVGSGQDYQQMGRMYAIRAEGNNAAGGPFPPGWPVRSGTLNVLPTVGAGHVNPPCLADVDGDGQLEVGINGTGSPIQFYKGDGTAMKSMVNMPFGEGSDTRDAPSIPLIGSAAIGDLDNDGHLDIALPAAGLNAVAVLVSTGARLDFDHQVGVWDIKSGQFKPGWPKRQDDWQFFVNPIIADIDGDNRPEVITGSAGYWLHAWSAEGKEAEGWPKLTGSWITAAAAVGDMDGDGLLEVAVTTRMGFLFAWKTKGSVNGRIDWESFHHDNQNTGNYHTVLTQGVRKLSDGGGCGCRVGGQAAGAGGLLLLLGLALLARSRRGRGRR